MNVLALYNIKGGVGKTTTAVNLAWLSARDGARTLIWDLDPQGAATFTFRVKPKVQGGGRELLRDREALLAAIKGTDFEGLDLLPADFSYRNLDRILDRGGAPEERLAAVLAPLAEEYDRIFLDCPANISLLSENVFSAARVLLVPTIPTILSLRTLARLMKHLKTRPPSHRPLVLPFFSMVDRRKRLHRDVCDYAAQHGLGFLAREIPYSSVIEQMGVRRNPVGAYATGQPSRACAELWREVVSRAEAESAASPTGRAVRSLLEAAETAALPRSRPGAATRASDKWSSMTARGARFEDDDDAAEAGEEILEPARRAAEERRAARRDVPPPPPPARAPRGEVEFKVRVRSERDFDTLARLAAGSAVWPERTAIQENHFFDTRDGALRSAGYALRLRLEDRRRLLTAKGPASRTDRGLTERPEEEVEIDPAEAERILSGAASPLDVLRERSGARTRLQEFIASWAGDRPLARVGSFKNVRRYVGPLELVAGERSAAVSLEMDRTEFPGGRVDYEVEVEVAPEDAAVCRAALQDLFARADIPWLTAPSKAQRFFEALGKGQG